MRGPYSDSKEACGTKVARFYAEGDTSEPIKGTIGARTAHVRQRHPPRSFNPQFVVGEKESILIGLRPALGLGLLSFRPPGLN